MEEFVGYIYCISNNVNQKKYIGQTSTTIRKRFADHIRCARSGEYDSQILYRAMRKYGVDNFSIETLETVCACSRSELKSLLNERESYYIEKFNCLKPIGYNMTIGGDSFAEHVVRPVCKVDTDGFVVALYGCMSDAEADTGIPHGSIKRALASESHYANGWFWYENANFNYKFGDNLGLQCRRDYTPVYQFDMAGNLIAEFCSIIDAERVTGVNHSHISSVCLKDRKSAGGYLWSQTRIPPVHVSNQAAHRCIPVLQMDLEGNIIATFDSSAQAGRRLGLQQSLISSCCRGQRKSTGGYRWAFLLSQN